MPGVMFPEPELFGVDLVIPDLARARRLSRADRRARPHARPRRSHRRRRARDRPRRRSDLRLAVHARARRAEARGARHRRRATGCVAVAPRADASTVGPFRLEFLRVTHSMPDCLARRDSHAGRRHRPHRRLQDRSDAARRPAVRPASLRRARQRGRAGAASPTAPTPTGRGFTGSERDVIDGFEEVFSSATGKIVVTAFSTSVYRLQLLVDLAEQFERKVAFVGRGMQQTSQIAERLGYLRIPPGVQIRDSEVGDYPAAGRPVPLHRLAGRAAGRAAPHRHRRPPARQARARRTSSSSRPGSFPGNEKAIGRVMNHVARRGADVVTDGDKHVHVSGHGSAGRAEIGAVPRQAALLRADTW